MNTSLSATITSFFTVHLSKVMGYSDNTIKSYRDTFVLLFNYADEKHLCPKGRISIDIFKKENIKLLRQQIWKKIVKISWKKVI